MAVRALVVKRRNYNTLRVGPILDIDGVKVTNLEDATEVTFVIKTDKGDLGDTKVTKTLTGGGITVDKPEEGYLLIFLTDSESNLSISYYMAVEILWTSDGATPTVIDKQEINLMEDGNLVERILFKDDIIA